MNMIETYVVCIFIKLDRHLKHDKRRSLIDCVGQVKIMGKCRVC